MTYFVVALSLIAFYKLFEKIFPVSRSAYTTNKNLAALKIQYVPYDFKQQGLFILVAAAAGFLLVKILPWLLDFRLSFVADQVIMVKPDINLCYLISIFSGMLLAVPVTFIIIKRQLKEDFTEYLAYMNLKYKFNAIKVMKYTVCVIAVMVSMLIIMYFDSYCAFGQQEVKINGIFSLGTKTYRYADIKKIKDVERLYAPNGNIVNDPHFIVEFADGTKWNSRDNGLGNYDQNTTIIDLIRSKTNLELIKMEFEE